MLASICFASKHYGFSVTGRLVMASDCLGLTSAESVPVRSPAPCCVNCQDFSGAQSSAEVCMAWQMVWQVVVPALVVCRNRCKFWTTPLKA
jgi:hypothetical protein